MYNRLMTILPISCLALWACGGENTNSSLELETSETAQPLTCEQQCSQTFSQCEYYCELQYDPYWEEARYNACVNDCWDEYNRCAISDFRFEAKTYQICHLDPDTHFDGVDVELYTADRYRDHSCAQNPDRYRKYLLDSVHCGFHSQSTCETRVTNRINNTWVPQGYFPTFAQGDVDYCPTPRL